MDKRVYDIPEAFGPLFEAHRNKVMYGGRGAARSWSAARALNIIASSRRRRILCAREYQNSIDESVHHLLEEQIGLMNIAGWDVGRTNIKNHLGSEFIFAGLRKDPAKIKSMEGIDIVWVEEAETVSNESWDMLIPTIRKTLSEIWLSFNPTEEKAATYQRFVVNPPPDTVLIKTTWRDNPFFPEVLKRERDYMWRIDPDRARHIWDGECRSQSQASIFGGKWVVEGFEPRDDWSGPHYGADWGFSQDPTALIRFWIDGTRLLIEHEAYGVGVEITDTPALFRSVPGAGTHLIRADSARPETISHMKRQGFQIRAAKKWTGCVEDGVEFIRGFDKIVIHPRCTHTQDEFENYSYKVDRLSGDVLPIILDKWNHMIDALRYGCEPLMRVKEWRIA